MAKDSDVFVQKIRGDTQLRVSFAAYIQDYRDQLMREMVSINEVDKLRIAQGAIRGLDRLKAHVEREGKVISEQDNDESAIRAVR